MGDYGFTLFDTAIGCCGIAWGPGGIVSVQLPEADADATVRRLLLRCPAATQGVPPPSARTAIDAVTALLGGASRDLLLAVELDLSGVPDFHRRVYEVARAIPPGQTLTYGQVAARLGDPGAARAVGQALGNNPFAPIVPCHRVLAAGDRMHGFSASGGIDTKRRMLVIEGAVSPPTPDLFGDANA